MKTLYIRQNHEETIQNTHIKQQYRIVKHHNRAPSRTKERFIKIVRTLTIIANQGKQQRHINNNDTSIQAQAPNRKYNTEDRAFLLFRWPPSLVRGFMNGRLKGAVNGPPYRDICSFVRAWGVYSFASQQGPVVRFQVLYGDVCMGKIAGYVLHCVRCGKSTELLGMHASKILKGSIDFRV